MSTWPDFLEEEFVCAIVSCSNSSVPSSDKLPWSCIKRIIKNKLKSIVSIANTYLELGHWLNHFKKSTTIVIPKPNKSSYNLLKSFRPIVLLNTIGKLIEQLHSPKPIGRIKVQIHHRCGYSPHSFHLHKVDQKYVN